MNGANVTVNLSDLTWARFALERYIQEHHNGDTANGLAPLKDAYFRIEAAEFSALQRQDISAPSPTKECELLSELENPQSESHWIPIRTRLELCCPQRGKSLCSSCRCVQQLLARESDLGNACDLSSSVGGVTSATVDRAAGDSQVSLAVEGAA